MKKTSLILCDESRVDHGGFSFVRKRLGAAAGGQKIGASWFELQPGKKAFPFHYHLANEEAVFVLEGEGMLRNDKEEIPLRAGEYIAFPPGLAGKYQSHTQADLARLRAAGYDAPLLQVKEGVPRCIRALVASPAVNA